MDNNENAQVNNMNENANATPVIEPKPTFKQKLKGFWNKVKRPVLIGVGAAATIGGAALVKHYKDKHEAELQGLRDERDKAAEEWFNRGLLAAGHTDDPEPETEDVQEETYEEEEI